MKASPINHVAGGGLIDRRSFLVGGLAVLTAGSVDSSLGAEEGGKIIGDDFPDLPRIEMPAKERFVRAR